MPNHLESFNIRMLGSDDRIESFDCGDADLNDFILHMANAYQQELLTTTYIVQDNTTNKVVAYFSLAADKVTMSEFESKAEFNRFRKHKFPNAKRLKSYPAIKLCRIGVDLSARGLHLGSFMVNVVKQLCRWDMKFGCRFLTVDAYVDKIPFYRHNDFNEMTDADKYDPHTRTLLYDLKKLTIAAES